MHKFRIANTIREFVNIQALINSNTLEESAGLLSSWYNEAPNVLYWKQKINPRLLPPELRGDVQLARINSYLKSRIEEGKRKIARSNYPKLDFSLSELGSFIAIAGTLLLLLGYLHIFIVNSYFGIPYQQYFQVSDYVASSVNGLAAIFLSAFIAAAFGFLFGSTLRSYSVQAAPLYLETFSARANNWIMHLIGIAGFLALVANYYFKHRIDSSSFLVASLYVGILLIFRFCALFFSDSFRALFFLMFAYIATIQTISGAIREIERVLRVKGSPTIRTLEFSDRTYSEPEWYVLAITSSFVIMRHQPDGAIQVLPKSDLKRIDSVSSATQPQ